MPSALSRAADGANKGSIGGPYGALFGAIDGFFNGPLYQTTVQNDVKLGHIKPDPLSKTFSDFFSQEGEFSNLNSVSSSLNEMYQGGIGKTAPGLFDAIGNLGRDVNSWSKGLIPADAAAAVYRNTGQSRLSGGYGQSMQDQEDPRNLGLTSLDLEGRAESGVAGLEGLASALNPVSPVNLVFTPQQIQQRSDQIKSANAGITNQGNLVNAGIQASNTNTAISSAATLAALLAGHNNSAGVTVNTTNKSSSDMADSFWQNYWGSFTPTG